MNLQKISLFAFAGSLLLNGCAEEEKQTPNILFCIADDVTWLHMQAYGCSWVETPGFDYVAEQGILFNNAYTSNAKCSPSRASILTGRNTWQLEEACNHIPYYPEKFKSFMEVLGENGYHTGFTGKGYAPGKVAPVNGVERSLTGKRFSELKMEVPADGISTIDYASNFVEFLDTDTSAGPFCFWYGGFEPHRHYEFMSAARAGKKIDQIDAVPSFWPDIDSVRYDMLDYAFEIEWFDQHLLRMIETLRERKLLDNTIIVVTADNGMPFPRAKGQAYEYSNHLPLAIMWGEGITNPGREIDDFINFSDFAPTFLELAGINGEDHGMQEIWGESLAGYFNSASEGVVDEERDHMLIGKERHDIGRPHDWGYPIRGIIKGDLLYVRNFEPERWPAGNPETGYLNCDASPTKSVLINGRRNPETRYYWEMNLGLRPLDELYNIKEDPECTNNLALNAEYYGIINEYQEQLYRELKEQGDPRMEGKGYIFDEYLQANEEHQGFYEKFMNGEELKTGWVIPSDYERDFYQQEPQVKPE